MEHKKAQIVPIGNSEIEIVVFALCDRRSIGMVSKCVLV